MGADDQRSHHQDPLPVLHDALTTLFGNKRTRVKGITRLFDLLKEEGNLVKLEPMSPCVRRRPLKKKKRKGPPRGAAVRAGVPWRPRESTFTCRLRDVCPRVHSCCRLNCSPDVRGRKCRSKKKMQKKKQNMGNSTFKQRRRSFDGAHGTT